MLCFSPLVNHGLSGFWHINLMTHLRLAVIALLGALILPVAIARADEPLFGSTEVASSNIGSFVNWTGVLKRFQTAQSIGEGMCATAAGGSRSKNGGCAWEEWQGIIASLKGQDEMTQLKRVNAEFNSRRYTLDRVNWGMEDYWATVFEFIDRNGDCEDYAIAKYVTLRALGWPASRMRLVIVRDTKLDLNHAILAVYTSEGVFIGDNQVKGLVKASSIRHYRPIYSINENGWWLHRVKK